MNEVAQIELLIEEAKKTVAFADALKRLKNNKDFKEVILEGFMTTFAAEQVRAKALPHMQTEAGQKHIDGNITAVGFFARYMDVLLTQGITAAEALQSHEDEMRYALEGGE